MPPQGGDQNASDFQTRGALTLAVARTLRISLPEDLANSFSRFGWDVRQKSLRLRVRSSVALQHDEVRNFPSKVALTRSAAETSHGENKRLWAGAAVKDHIPRFVASCFFGGQWP